MNKKKVIVGMSGGVDSSLSAALLVEAGYDVTGAYMKNWTRDLPGFVCPWREDYHDAKNVAVSLGIPLIVMDFETQYRRLVVEYMLSGYKKGLTPNPDIMCNQEVKFKLFLSAAEDAGVAYIATGHYALSKDGRLYKGKDKNKDQSYFLYRVTEPALKRTLFPIGHLTKTEVRREAKSRHLLTADKPDSQGICFVGEVGIKQFLLSELGEQPKGEIIDQDGKVIGEHDGALFYTIGQRHGLNVGGGLPYYVTSKDMKKNTIYVTNDIGDLNLWSEEILIGDLWWINDPPVSGLAYQVRCRYRSESIDCQIALRKNQATLNLDEAVKAASPGQSAVIYDGERVVGGGIIKSTTKAGRMG